MKRITLIGHPTLRRQRKERVPLCRRVVTTVASVVVVVFAGAAFAAWLADGSGQGEVVAGEAVALEISPVTPSAALYPGVSADLVVEIDNPNPYNVAVDTITTNAEQDPSIVVDSGVCSDADVVWNDDVTYTGGDRPVLAAGGSTQVTLTDAVTMVPDAHNDCQQATFTVHLSLTGESVG